MTLIDACVAERKKVVELEKGHMLVVVFKCEKHKGPFK
jgi:hypothetical protein